MLIDLSTKKGKELFYLWISQYKGYQSPLFNAMGDADKEAEKYFEEKEKKEN